MRPRSPGPRYARNFKLQIPAYILQYPDFGIWNLEAGMAERPSLGLPIFGADYRVDAAANIEVANDGHRSGTARLHEIIQYFIDDRFVKSTLIAIGPKVKLQRLELDANFIRYVFDPDRGKIRLASARAHAGELRTLHADLVVTLRSRVGKGFQLLTRFRCHALILARAQDNSKLPGSVSQFELRHYPTPFKPSPEVRNVLNGARR
jgi:hypothetical protein